MSRIIAGVLLFVMMGAATASAEQTLVFFRHGEKPSSGLGQLSCQGLNRALALPDVLLAKFGTPHFVYAPNPAVKITDQAGSYYYVRPLAAIEPLAIRVGLAVNVKYGYDEISRLQASLITSAKANTTSFVAWEHSQLVNVVRSIMTAYGGGGGGVPSWTTGDYDSLYVVRVTYGSSGPIARFERDRENLNNQPTSCPR